MYSRLYKGVLVDSLPLYTLFSGFSRVNIHPYNTYSSNQVILFEQKRFSLVKEGVT